MTKLEINPKTGLVDSPIYPCVKGEGLCRLRATGGDFTCALEAKFCRYRVKEKEKKDA